MLEEDNKQYNELVNEFSHLISEDYTGAYNLSQRALILCDRWNDIGLEVEKISAQKGATKTVVGDWIYNRYRMCSKIHDMARMVWSKGVEQNKFNGK